MSIESAMPSNHLILCYPLLFLPSIFPSITVFSNESVLHIRWPEYCSFSFSISPSSEYSGLISFRMDWLDLFAVQESSPAPQFKSISSLVRSFLCGQALTSNMTTGRTVALTRWAFVDSDVSAFYTLSRFVITFLPRSKCLLTSWLQSPSAVILEPKKRKSVTVTIVSSCICHGVMGQDAIS